MSRDDGEFETVDAEHQVLFRDLRNGSATLPSEYEIRDRALMHATHWLSDECSPNDVLRTAAAFEAYLKGNYND